MKFVVVPFAPSTVDVFVVLKEDDYETTHGDGYFAYYAATFRSRAEADAFAVAKKAEPLAKGASGYSYHVRPAKLSRGADGAWTMTADLHADEKIDVDGDSAKTNYDPIAAALGLT